ncbi:MAG: hypothetical protein IJF80_01235 [Clostridia bacterium]|nr:hypothetical protein [Clostridia bacterium]
MQQPFNINAQMPDIDTKNLGIIQDQMQHEALAYKKSSLYAESFRDPSLSQIARQTAQHHKQHFDALQSYLNSHK